MRLLDSLLNLACVLLWLNWRSVWIASRERSSPLSLASTVRKAEPRPTHGWFSLAVLLLILLLRGLFYWNVGSALSWTPSLELGVVSLPFRSDYPARMLLFSALSFVLVLASLYVCLLLISVINRSVPNDEPIHRLVRLHLGWVERSPAWLKLILPMALAALAWGFGSPTLVQLGIVPPPLSTAHLWQQAVLLGLTTFLTWKILLIALCLLFAVNSYVYLGNSRFWRFVHVTGSNFLYYLRRLPVRIGKVDFAPVLAIGVVLTLAHLGGKWLPSIYQRLPL